VKAALTAGACVLALAGCGERIRAPDLFIVYRSGTIAGASLTLLVNEEGGVHCNGVSARALSDPQLLQARALQEELKDPASSNLALPPARGSVFHYHVRDQDGTVTFNDNSPHQPAVLHRLALFVLQAAQRNCALRL
jgi:hypothetical protein